MLEVVDNYKLIDVEIDGVKKTLQIDTKDAWGVMEVQSGDKVIKVNELDEIEFITETGEKKQGTVNKITSSGEKTKFQIQPTGMDYEEIWSVKSVKSGTLKILDR